MDKQQQLVSFLESVSIQDLTALINNIDRGATKNNPARLAFLNRVRDVKRTGGDPALLSRLASEVLSRPEADSILTNLIRLKEPEQAQKRVEEGKVPYELGKQFEGGDQLSKNIQASSEAYLKNNPQSRSSNPSYINTQFDRNDVRTGTYPDSEVPQDIRDFIEAYRNSNRKPSSGSSSSSSKSKRSDALDPIEPPDSLSTEGRRPADLDPFEGLSEGFKSIFQNNIESFKNRPDFQEQQSQNNLDRLERTKRFLDDFKPMLGPIVDAFDMIQQNQEVGRAERIADRSMRNQPNTPSVRGENRMLANLIRESEVARMNPMAELQPAIEQTNLGYQQDLARSREYSGGQSGTMMGLGQAAAIRRDQQGRAIGGMASDIYNQGITRTAGLVEQQMQDDTWRDQQNIDIYKQRDQRNILEQQQAGIGLAATRARQLQARNNFYDSLLDSPVFDINSYMGRTRQNLQTPSIFVNGISQQQEELQRIQGVSRDIYNQGAMSARQGLNNMNQLPTR